MVASMPNNEENFKKMAENPWKYEARKQNDGKYGN